MLPSGYPLCFICGKSVRIEIAKADESGNAVHEDCYVMRMNVQFGRLVFEGLSATLPPLSTSTLNKLSCVRHSLRPRGYLPRGH
jgi:hypothetical protein